MRKLIFGTLIAIVVVGMAFLFEHSYEMNRKIPKDSQKSGETFEQYTVKNFQTKEVLSLDKFKGKVVLVNFWATWCAACLEEMPSIVELRNKLLGKPFEVLLINVDEDPTDNVLKTAERMKINFPIYTDVNEALANHFQISAIPFSVVFKKDLSIAWDEEGARDWNSDEVINEIQKLF